MVIKIETGQGLGKVGSGDGNRAGHGSSAYQRKCPMDLVMKSVLELNAQENTGGGSQKRLQKKFVSGI